LAICGIVSPQASGADNYPLTLTSFNLNINASNGPRNIDSLNDECFWVETSTGSITFIHNGPRSYELTVFNAQISPGAVPILFEPLNMAHQAFRFVAY
jgi:hypothetical protein